MKRLLSFVFVFFLLCSFSPLALADEEPATYISGDFTYSLLEDGSAEIIQYDGYAEDLFIPATLDGHTVTSIGNRAFSWCSSLSSVSFPKGLESIKDNAFQGCDSISSVSLPDSLLYMGVNPFVGCDELTDIYVSPENPCFAVIDNVLFEKTSKRLVCYPAGLCASSYAIPDGILEIGDYAFSCCCLSSVSFAEGLLSIGDSAFDFCETLSSVSRMVCSPSAMRLLVAASPFPPFHFPKAFFTWETIRFQVVPS